MLLKLSDDEFVRIQKKLSTISAIQNQVNNLLAQGNEIKDIVNTAWRDAHRGAQLEDKEFRERLGDDTVPPMINGMGQQVVIIDAKTRTARWETHHDAKRIAKEPETEGLASGTMEEQLLEKVEELEQAKEAESDCNDKGDEITEEEE